MKAMLIGLIAIAVIAVGADRLLNQMGFASEEKFASQSVRLD